MERTRRIAADMAGAGVAIFARLVTAVRAIWDGIEPVPAQRVYFANHTSNADLVLIWAVLPRSIRARTRPVAASDYWLRSPLRAFFGRDVFRGLLIDRNAETRTEDPVAKMAGALDEGWSLIIFPEGGRNQGPDPLLPFKTGLYHLARQRPGVDLVPVWIANLNNVLPKGEIIPLPLVCTVRFGAPLHIGEDEDRDIFLARAREALLSLRPEETS